MRSTQEVRRRDVFLNFPFDRSYERRFVALIASLVALGRIPRCVLEVPETGEGRLSRLFTLIRSCPVSIHDLSRVGSPVRFNMPFELGLAVALGRVTGQHQFIVLETKQHRLQKTLSDLNGIDPGIHGGSSRGTISCVLSHLGKRTGNPAPRQVFTLYRKLWKTTLFLKKDHGRLDLYSRAIFSDLVKAAILLAKNDGFLSD